MKLLTAPSGWSTSADVIVIGSGWTYNRIKPAFLWFISLVSYQSTN